MHLAPVVLFVYNRPEHTLKVLESLSENYSAGQSELFIFSDGIPENAGTELMDKVREVRRIIRKKNWCGKVHIIEAAGNKGLAESVISGVTEIVNRFGKVIVLEDDLVSSPWMLTYMNDALEYYKDDERVISATGYIYPVAENLPETFFLKGADCWSWCTWKRGWDLFEADGKKLLDELVSTNQTFEFDFNGSYPFTNMLRDQVKGLNSSWAIRWYASAFLKNKLTLYPGISVVQNIGIDGSGTHSGNSRLWDVQTSKDRIHVGSVEVVKNPAAYNIIVRYFKQLSGKPGILQRITQRFNKLFF